MVEIYKPIDWQTPETSMKKDLSRLVDHISDREALEKILQRLRGPASAQTSDIREIVQAALAATPAEKEVVLEQSEDMKGNWVQTVRLANGEEIVRKVPQSAATPAVGVLVKDIAKLMDKHGISPPPPPRFWIDLEQMLYAAKPASPLRGREALETYRRASHVLYGTPEHRALIDRADDLCFAALSAAAPEQPAATLSVAARMSILNDGPSGVVGKVDPSRSGPLTRPAAAPTGREALLAAQSALNNPLNMDLRDRAFHAINRALTAPAKSSSGDKETQA